MEIMWNEANNEYAGNFWNCKQWHKKSSENKKLFKRLILMMWNDVS